jgi:hypothetical protein
VKLFRPRRGSSGWEYTTRGFLWRVCPAPGGRLIGEDRDVEKKQASFFCLALSDGKPLWKDRTFGEAWWIGIDSVFRDVLVLHRFSSPDIPEPMGITVVDIETGDVLWQRSDAVFAGLAGEDLLVRVKGGLLNEGRLVERRSGREVDETRTVSASGPEEWEGEWRFPEALPAGDPIDVLARSRGAVDEVPSTVIAAGRVMVLGYHTRAAVAGEGPAYDSRIALVDVPAKRVEREMTMETNVRRPMPDTFLVREEILYCIRDRRVLAAVPLTE